MSESDIQRLLGLAADRSQSARGELMNAMVDFFLSPTERLTDHQRALMGDVLGKLLGSIELDVRHNLADALVRSGMDMPDLVRQLANDDIVVARTVLEKSSLLKDIDLIEIVKARSDEHRMAIAIRDSLSEEVTEALVDYSGPDVIEALLRNEDAVISRRSMEYLVAESRRFDQFQEPLLNRSELPAELAYRMYWWVSAALRRKILRDFSIDETLLDGAMERATKQAQAELDEGQSARARAMRMVRRMSEIGELTDSFLLRSLRQQRVMVFVAGLAERAEISYDMAWKIVSDRGQESFIVLARAIDIGRDVLAPTVLLLGEVQNPEAVRRPDILNRILSLFDKLDPAHCTRVLHLWQRDADYQGAVRALEDSSVV